MDGRSRSIPQLLGRLRDLDIHLRAEGDKLRFNGPVGALDDELREELKRRKPEILAFLREVGTGLTVSWDRGVTEAGQDARRQAAPATRERTWPRGEDGLAALGPAAAAFRATLHEVGLLSTLAAFGRGGVRDEAIVAARPGMAPDLGAAVDFLCLSRTVALDMAQRLVGEALFEHLVAVGLVATDEDRAQMPSARVVEHYGHHLFVGAPGRSENGHYGADSLGLGRLLLGVTGRCLDLMSSTGAQTLTMVPGAEEVVAVEVDRALQPVMELNLLLDGCREKVDVRWSDALETQLGGPFDAVSVNPPMLPNFGLRLPWRADGGPHGYSVLRAAARRVELAPAGRLAAVTMAPGDERGPALGWLTSLAAEKGWSCTVIPTGAAPLHRHSYIAHELATVAAPETGITVEEAIERLVDRWSEEGVTHLYFCLLSATPHARPGSRVASTAFRGEGWWL